MILNFDPAILELDMNYVVLDHDKHSLCDSYIVRFLHDVTENYYERGTYAFTYCNNIKLPNCHDFSEFLG